MIDAEEIEDGRVEIMYVNRALYDPITKLISFAIELPRMQERWIFHYTQKKQDFAATPTLS
jgi:hypothetical protein